MCKLICERFTTPIIRTGSPFRHYHNLDSENRRPRNLSHVYIYRGLHDVFDVNLNLPGSWWSLHAPVAAQYAEPTEVMFVPQIGTVVAGHILRAEVSIHYSDVWDVYSSFLAIRRGNLRNTQNANDLFQVFVPKEDFPNLIDVRVDSSRVLSVLGNFTNRDYFD